MFLCFFSGERCLTPFLKGIISILVLSVMIFLVQHLQHFCCFFFLLWNKLKLPLVWEKNKSMTILNFFRLSSSSCVHCRLLETQFSRPHHPSSLASWNMAFLPITGLIMFLQRSPMALSSILWHLTCHYLCFDIVRLNFFETLLLVGFHDTMMQCFLYFIVSPFLIYFFISLLPNYSHLWN